MLRDSFADVRLMEFLRELGFDFVIRFRGDTFVAAADLLQLTH